LKHFSAAPDIEQKRNARIFCPSAIGQRTPVGGGEKGGGPGRLQGAETGQAYDPERAAPATDGMKIMKKQILSTVAAMAVLVAADAAQAGWANGLSTNGFSNGMSLNGLGTSNALTGNGLDSANALTGNGLNGGNAVNTETPASGARVIFIELPAAR